MSFDVGAAYGGSASAWAAGPSAIYRALAAPLVHDCPIPLAGARVLDIGAGTGATTEVMQGADAAVTATDLSFDMLAAERDRRPPAAAADALRLPFRGRTFDVSIGGFVLSHIPTPAAALRECARVVREQGAVMTIGFDGRWEIPAKHLVEDVMTDFGFRRPAWYDTFKREVEPLTASPDRLVAVADSAGLAEVTVREHTVDTGVRTADGIVTWRLGTPAYATFMDGLDNRRRADVLEAVRAAVGPDPEPMAAALLVLTGRVRPDR